MSKHLIITFLRKFLALGSLSIILLCFAPTCGSAGLLGDDGSVKLVDKKGTGALKALELDNSKGLDDNAVKTLTKSEDYSKKEAKNSPKTSQDAAKESAKTADKQSDQSSKHATKMEKESEDLSYKSKNGFSNYELQEGEENTKPCYAKLAGPKECAKNEDCCTNFCIYGVNWCFRRPMDWPSGHAGAKGMWDLMAKNTKPPCYRRLALAPKKCKENDECCSHICMENGWCYSSKDDWPSEHAGLEGFTAIGDDEPCYKKFALAPKKCKTVEDCCTNKCTDLGWCFRGVNDWPTDHPGTKKNKNSKPKDNKNSKESEETKSSKTGKGKTKDEDEKSDKSNDSNEKSSKKKKKSKEAD